MPLQWLATPLDFYALSLWLCIDLEMNQMQNAVYVDLVDFSWNAVEISKHPILGNYFNWET